MLIFYIQIAIMILPSHSTFAKISHGNQASVPSSLGRWIQKVDSDLNPDHQRGGGGLESDIPNVEVYRNAKKCIITNHIFPWQAKISEIQQQCGLPPNEMNRLLSEHIPFDATGVQKAWLWQF